jgi:hypothetical protein
MNKCPYEWRLTSNIQNRDRTENTHTHTHIDQEIIRKQGSKISKKGV